MNKNTIKFLHRSLLTVTGHMGNVTTEQQVVRYFTTGSGYHRYL